MNAIVEVWLAFATCLAIIGLAGPRLSSAADVIADKTGLSGSWIGLILVATVTSLPELTTGLSAVTAAGAPDIAVGDIFGSCVFNLAILTVLDFMQRGENVYRRVRQGHILSAGFGVIMIAFAGMSLLLHGRGASFSVGHVGGYTPIIFILYALGMRAAFGYEREHRDQVAEGTSRYPRITLHRAMAMFSTAGLAIIVVGSVLPFVAAQLAEIMGWHRTFVGTLLVAMVTSLPEVVVCAAAVRLGALDMAVANLLGSNLFNIAILGIDDLFFIHGPLLSRVSPVHAVSAMSAVLMSGIVIVGLVYRPQRRLFRTVGWVSLGLFAMYLLNSFALYLYAT